MKLPPPYPLSLLVCGSLALQAVAAPASQRVEVTRDLWISSYDKEREGSNGGSPKLKLKGIQEFFLIDLDPAPWRGKRILRAELHLHLEGSETLGRITVSTVADEWVEGGGTGYAKVPGASCFRWARTGEAAWGGNQPDVTAVINGAGGSIWSFGDASPRDANSWQVIPIDPAVVQARIEGRSHGFCVIDDVGSEYRRDGNKFEYRPFLNRYVTSREGAKKSAPYFSLWLEDGAAPQPPTPSANPAPITAAKLPDAAPAARRASAPTVEVRDEFGEPLATLEFFAARGETIGFSVAMPAKETNIAIPGVKIRRFAMPKVAGQIDPLVPVDFTGAPVDPAGGDGGTFIEMHIPKDAKAGRHEGSLQVGGKTMPCGLTVWDFTLPDRLSFLPQMNCYGLPDHEREYYRLAHEHRTVLNRLPYGWTGRVKSGPTIHSDGRWDWTAWDAEVGPLLDGSAFRDLPRSGVPIEAYYLPLNENWPMDHERHFRGGYWIESAYDEEYWREFRAAAARFAEHFAARRWTEPMFEFYLNNKVSFKAQREGRWDITSAPWILDEPSNTQDFWALRRFGLEFWRGVAAHPGARFVFRADLSRPEWQRDLLDGVTSVEVVSGILRTYHERVVKRASEFGNLVFMYGSANRLGTPNVMPAAWCVETWALGADGVVPWQTIGKPDAWQQPDPLALFYPTPNGPVPSLRLKSFRAGQQLVEYLTLYTALSGESRAAIGAAILAEPGLRATLEKKSEADAGGSLFGPEAPHSLTALRLRLGHWLQARSPAPRERWHDPRPQPRDPTTVRTITPLPAPG